MAGRLAGVAGLGGNRTARGAGAALVGGDGAARGASVTGSRRASTRRSGRFAGAARRGGDGAARGGGFANCRGRCTAGGGSGGTGVTGGGRSTAARGGRSTGTARRGRNGTARGTGVAGRGGAGAARLRGGHAIARGGTARLGVAGLAVRTERGACGGGEGGEGQGGERPAEHECGFSGPQRLARVRRTSPVSRGRVGFSRPADLIDSGPKDPTRFGAGIVAAEGIPVGREGERKCANDSGAGGRSSDAEEARASAARPKRPAQTKAAAVRRSPGRGGDRRTFDVVRDYRRRPWFPATSSPSPYPSFRTSPTCLRRCRSSTRPRP